MSSDEARQAAALLFAARRDCRPLESLPADCRPSGEKEAYAIQDALVAAMAGAGGGQVVGYKIGATSRKAQSYLQTEGPFSGQVLAANLLDSPQRLEAASYNLRVIEPEFAFRLGGGLGPRAAPYEEAEVAAAVETLLPAIEVITCGMVAWNRQGVASLIADNGVNGALILGAAFAGWRDLDLGAHRVSVRINDAEGGEGQGANALGHPLTALTWLANHLSRRGRGLEAGQVVTTGVVTPFHEVMAGDRVEADFGRLGKVILDFS